MSGHGGIQECGAGKMCSLPTGVYTLYEYLLGRAKLGNAQALGLAPWVTVPASLVRALSLTPSFMKILCCAQTVWDHLVHMLCGYSQGARPRSILSSQESS